LVTANSEVAIVASTGIFKVLKILVSGKNDASYMATMSKIVFA
jgi:hypothetical protein